MIVSTYIPPSHAKRHWLAELKLRFETGGGRTKMVRAAHRGPVRVQRPFYPEGSCCHVYLLHPPGGIAPGDRIDVDVFLAEGSDALVTTPSAGKVYTSDRQRSLQDQHFLINAQNRSSLDWLPQETIVFSGANARLSSRFDLEGDARLVGWDMVCLGRRAHGEVFSQGSCRQLLEINRDGRPLMREQMNWRGGSKLLRAEWGMAGQVVSGTFFATLELPRSELDELRKGLAALNAEGEWGISQKPGIFLARYLGQSAGQGRKVFEFLWRRLRPRIKGRPACPPRIWNT